MSYDTYLRINTGGSCDPVVVEVGNYTSNVSGMWNKALGKSLKEFTGQIAKDALPELEKGLNYMLTHSDELRLMNPTNGWGNYEGACRYLADLVEACSSHPNCTIDISC